MDFGDHKSWQAYQESLSEPLRFEAGATEAERDHAFAVLKKANDYFYQQHLSTLPPEIRVELDNGTHPSQSHERDEQAQPIFEKFRSFLDKTCTIPITDVSLGHYHGNRVIFYVRFDSEKSWSEIDEEIPIFFEGFWVKRVRQSEYDALNTPDLHKVTEAEYGENFVPRVRPNYYRVCRAKPFSLFFIGLAIFFGYKSIQAELGSENFWFFGAATIFCAVLSWGILDETRCPKCKKFFSSIKSRVEIQKYHFKTKKIFKDAYHRSVEDYRVCRFCGYQWVEVYDEDNLPGGD